MREIIDGKVYNTDTATLIADDRFWDGHNFERKGRNSFLWKTKKGAFFMEHTTFWQGERDYLEPLSKAEAMERYEMLACQKIEYEEAFGVEPIEA